jgi:hypothetical protein
MNLAQFFPAYKRLQRDLNETLSDKMRLQDQLVSLQADNAWLRVQMQSAMDQERDARKMMVNVSWQALYGFRPHPEAPGLPERLNTPADEGQIKRKDHWLIQQQEGRRESQAAIERWLSKWKDVGKNAQQAVYGPEAPLKDGDKLAQPEEMVLGE